MMMDLSGQKLKNHQNETPKYNSACARHPPASKEDQKMKSCSKDNDVMIAADLNLYASPMTILQTCKKSGSGKREKTEKSTNSASGGHMIAADLRKYGNPLDEK